MHSTFLSGGGATGELIRAHDWRGSPLGAPEGWPQPLKTIVDVMLTAPQPMFVAWGPLKTMLYNDGYAEILGRHHPAAIGAPFEQVWAEIIEQVGPIMARAYAGEPTYMDDIELVMRRHGHDEETHFSFFYTPLRTEGGEVEGVFCACNEITAQVYAARERGRELQRLRDLFEQSRSFIAVLEGPEHVFRLTNPSYLQLVGPRDLIGKTVREALPEIEGQGFFELLDSVYRSGETFLGRALPVELQSPGVSGPRRLYVDFTFQALKDAAGASTGVFVEGVDVTSAIESQNTVRASEEKFRTFSQVMPNQVWTSMPDGDLDWFNDQTLRYSGCTHESLAGSGWTDIVHPQDVPAAREAWQASLLTGQPYEIEFRIRRHDGVHRWHLVRALPIRDADGRITRWIGTNTDIEDQRAAREELLKLNDTLERRVSERTLERERIWRNAPDLMIVIDTDGTIRDVNPAWRSVLDLEPQELVGQAGETIVHPDDVERYRLALSQASMNVLPAFHCRLRHRNGSYRWLAWTAAPEGQTIYGFGRDVTAEKDREREVAALAEQLRHAQKMEAVGQLTGGIAHDFNNMLAGILGSIELIRRRLDGGDRDGVVRLLESAESSTRRASTLTHRLLAFARRQPLNIERVEVGRLLESLEDLLARTLGAGVTLRLAVPPDLWDARIDAAQLESALLNLAINSRDAMPAGGTLTIRALNQACDAGRGGDQGDVAGDYVLIQVTDTGAGMPASVVEKAFDPFFTTKPLGQGTGLGLSMIYGFLKQAGGHVDIDSTVGRGTTVTLYLPRDLSDAPANEAGESQFGRGSTAGETILLVEDDADLRLVQGQILQELGYAHLEAGDAPAALQLLETRRRIDLLVTDVGLPGMNGRQLAEIARTLRPDLPVLFLTGYAEQSVLRKGQLPPRMQMITKPVSIDVLAEVIRGMLNP